MWELDHKESWELKNCCFWTVVLEKSLESPLHCKKIKSVNLKGNQSWILIRRTDADAEVLIFWPPDVKNWLTRKDPDAEKDSRQEKGTTEDEIVEWYFQLSCHEFAQTPGDGEGQGSLGVLHSIGSQRVGLTEWLNGNKVCLWISLVAQ